LGDRAAPDQIEEAIEAIRIVGLYDLLGSITASRWWCSTGRSPAF